MINDEKGWIGIYQKAQEGASNHSMPSLVQPGDAWQPRNTGIHTTNPGYNGQGATAPPNVPHTFETPNRNNNSRNINQDSVIVRNNLPSSNTFENLREEVTGMIGLNQLNDFKFVSTPIQVQNGGNDTKTNGHKHSNAKIDFKSSLTANHRQVGVQSSSMTSTSCTVDNSSKGLSKKISDSLTYLTPETAQLLKIYPPVSRQFQIESNVSKPNFLDSKVKIQNQKRQSIIKSGNRRHYSLSTPAESISSHKILTTESLTLSELYNMIAVPVTSAGKTLHYRPIAQHVPSTSSITGDLGIPSLPLAKAPIRPEPSSYAKVPSHEESADSLPKIVSLYSLNTKSMQKPEKSQKTKNRRKRNKTVNFDPAASSNNTTRTISTGNQAKVKSDPNLHFTHTVSNKKNCKNANIAQTDQQQNFEISSSSLDAWFKSTQSSALEMQVLKSPAAYSNVPSTNTSSKTSVTTIQGKTTLNPQVTFPKTFRNKSPDPSKIVGKSNPSSCKISKSKTTRNTHAPGIMKDGKLKTTKNAIPVSTSPQDMPPKSVAISQSQMKRTHSSGSIDRTLQTTPNPILNSCTSVSTAEHTAETTNMLCVEKPLDYSMKTLNQTFKKKEDGLQIQPLDLTLSKLQTKPSPHTKTVDIKHNTTTARKDNVDSSHLSVSNLNESRSKAPKHDLIMEAIDRVINMSKAAHASFTNHEHLNDRATVTKHAISSVSTSTNSTAVSASTSGMSVGLISSSKDASPCLNSMKTNSCIGVTSTINVPGPLTSVSSQPTTNDALSFNSSKSQLNEVVSDDIRKQKVCYQVNEITTPHTREEMTTDVCARGMGVEENRIINKLSSDSSKSLQNTTSDTGKVKTPVANELSQPRTENAIQEKTNDAPEQSVHDVDIEVINGNSSENKDGANEEQENPSRNQVIKIESVMVKDSSDMKELQSVNTSTNDALTRIDVKENEMQENHIKIQVDDDSRNVADEFGIKMQQKDEDDTSQVEGFCKENRKQENLPQTQVEQMENESIKEKTETGDTKSGNLESTRDIESLTSTKSTLTKTQQLVVKVRKNSDGQFRIINKAGAQKEEEIDNNSENLNPVKVIKSKEVKKASEVDVSIDDFDIITLIPHVPKPGPDIMVLEEACCDEYDNMHFNDEHEFGENESREMFYQEENSNLHLNPLQSNGTDDIDVVAECKTSHVAIQKEESKSPDSPHQTAKTIRNKVIHVRNYSQDVSPKISLLEPHLTSDQSNISNDQASKSAEITTPVKPIFIVENKVEEQSQSKLVEPNSDLTRSQARIHSPQSGEISPVKSAVGDMNDSLTIVSESTVDPPISCHDDCPVSQIPTISPINQKIADVHEKIPSIKEEIFDYKLPLKRKSSIKLGYNVHVGIKSPELLQKRRKLIAKDIKPVVKVSKSKPFSIILSDSEESSDEGEEVFKTPKFKKSNMKRKLTQSQNITTPSEINMEIAQTCEPTIEVKPFILLEKPTEVLFQSSSSDDNTDLDENLKNIVDNIISSTSEKQTSKPVKRKKVDKVPFEELSEKEKKRSARLGNWGPTEFPVMKNIPIQPLLNYNKTKIKKEHISAFKYLMILQNLMKMGVLTNESTKMNQEPTIQYDYNGSLLYIPGGIKLKPCVVRLEKLDF